jgi:hypothetical protein
VRTLSSQTDSISYSLEFLRIKAMAAYGSNSLAVRFKRELVDEPKERSAEMPPASPMMGGLHPGGKDVGPQPGRRYPKGMRNQPWKSWLSKGKPGIKRKRRRSGLASLMG